MSCSAFVSVINDYLVEQHHVSLLNTYENIYLIYYYEFVIAELEYHEPSYLTVSLGKYDKVIEYSNPDFFDLLSTTIMEVIKRFNWANLYDYPVRCHTSAVNYTLTREQSSHGRSQL